MNTQQIEKCLALLMESTDGRKAFMKLQEIVAASFVLDGSQRTALMTLYAAYFGPMSATVYRLSYEAVEKIPLEGAE